MQNTTQNSPLVAGEQVTWIHEMRGGYGYVEFIDAEVLAVGPARIKILVALKTGQFVERHVQPQSLIRKSQGSK